jgi:hypothetical protein
MKFVRVNQLEFTIRGAKPAVVGPAGAVLFVSVQRDNGLKIGTK